MRSRGITAWTRVLAGLFACAGPATAACAELLHADATTQALLRRADFEQMVLSPNGAMIAIARRSETGSVVTIVSSDTLKVLRNIIPGKDGEIDTLRWLGDTQVIVGANKLNGKFGMPLDPPKLYVVPVAPGRKIVELPANFVDTIAGDPDHLLVSRCRWTSAGECRVLAYKAETGRPWNGGELLAEAPDVDTFLVTDGHGRVRFAFGYDRKGYSRTWVLGDDATTWTQINDEVKTQLVVYPVGMEADGRHGVLASERRQGTGVLERYDVATGARSDLLHEPGSDPLFALADVRTHAVIGGVFDATHPRQRYWDPTHPQARLQGQLEALFPDRRAFLTSMSEDGRLALVMTEGDRDPGSFHLVDLQANTVHLLARAKPWLDVATLAPTREVTIAARDQLVLKGLLTVPAGREARGLPLLVVPHGGPFDVQDTWGYSTEDQVLASHGYAVLRVNFRGSAGYGRDFADRGLRQWGKAMQDDVTDATRWAIAQGVADPARVCIYGASYGAYAAMMGAIREPALYRCAAGYAGVYDLNKLYRWDALRRSDLGREFLARAVGTDAADLAANSPAQQAGRIRADVFLAHGKLDGIADLRFARQLEKAINRSGGQKVDLVEYPNQGHGLKVPAQREDFYARLLAFLHASLDPAPVAAAP